MAEGTTKISTSDMFLRGYSNIKVEKLQALGADITMIEEQEGAYVKQGETVTCQSLQEKNFKEMYGFAKHYKILITVKWIKGIGTCDSSCSRRSYWIFPVEGCLSDINRAEGFGT